MKTKRNLLATAMLLTAVNAGFGQSTLQFTATGYTVAESAGSVTLTVERLNDTGTAVSVDFATVDGTATHGFTYVLTNGTLAFATSETNQTIVVPILNNGLVEGTKTFRVILTNATGGAVLGTRTNATVSITDNDVGVRFVFATYSVAEDAGAALLGVVRGDDGTLPVTVDLATTDLTAISGLDYTGTTNTLSFAATERFKLVAVPILNDGLKEANKTFRATLSNPVGATLGNTKTTTMTIVDNDQGFQFDSATYTVAEDAGVARIHVLRGSDHTNSTVTVDYATADLTATNGLDYAATNGIHTLTWTGGGTLQRADNVIGPWQTLPATKSPCTVQSPIPTTFYRVTRPRPANLYVPSSYDGHTSLPLVILLHGGHLTGEWIENYMRLRPQAEGRGFLYCYPTGTLDLLGLPFWNAYFENPTDAAAFAMTTVDDVGFLRGLVEEIASHFAVDRQRVYLIGHSNGGFMAYWMACEAADLVAGIASLGGTSFLVDWRVCRPSERVNILQIHGTADDAARYWGGALTLPSFWLNSPPFVGAVQQVQTWAGYNGASNPVTDPGLSLDLDLAVPGLGTVVTRYTNHPPGGAVELWTLNGGSHIPTLSAEFSPRVIDWLLAHPKP
ncbi:MAG: hypothetical protein HY674_03265 [Chloroflexi bacterium]|nr:hypothetical protein [Chloroflexota bacterium]